MKQTNIPTRAEIQPAQAQWAIEQASSRVTISQELSRQYFEILGYISTKLSEDKLEKLMHILNKEENPLVKYTEDPMGRNSWCVITTEKKSFAEDYIHYSSCSKTFVWTSNEGKPHTILDSIITDLDRDIQIAIYTAYTIKNLLAWGAIQDAKNALTDK